MIGQDNMMEILNRLNLFDYSFSSFRSDDDGDFIEGRVLDLDFDTVKNAIQKKKEFKICVDWDRSNHNVISLKMSEMVRGYLVSYRLNIERGALGVTISSVIKGIFLYDESGKEYEVPSYKKFRELLVRMSEGETVLDLSSVDAGEGV